MYKSVLGRYRLQQKDYCEAYTKHPDAGKTPPIYATEKWRGRAGKSAKQ